MNRIDALRKRMDFLNYVYHFTYKEERKRDKVFSVTKDGKKMALSTHLGIDKNWTSGLLIRAGVLLRDDNTKKITWNTDAELCIPSHDLIDHITNIKNGDDKEEVILEKVEEKVEEDTTGVALKELLKEEVIDSQLEKKVDVAIDLLKHLIIKLEGRSDSVDKILEENGLLVNETN